MTETLELVGRGVAMSSPGHGSRSADHHGTIVEVIAPEGEYLLLVVRWSDGRISVIPASECAVELDEADEHLGS